MGTEQGVVVHWNYCLDRYNTKKTGILAPGRSTVNQCHSKTRFANSINTQSICKLNCFFIVRNIPKGTRPVVSTAGFLVI